MHLIDMPRASSRTAGREGRIRYTPPGEYQTISLSELLRRAGREELESKQLDMLRRGETTSGQDINIYAAGDLNILLATCVSIVGTREVSEPGFRRAAWLAAKLAEAGVAIVSGLAKGVDTAALTSAAPILVLVVGEGALGSEMPVFDRLRFRRQALRHQPSKSPKTE
jgi:DNA processing protein